MDLLCGEHESFISYVCKLVDQDAAYPNLSREFKDLAKKWFYDNVYECALRFEKTHLKLFENEAASQKGYEERQQLIDYAKKYYRIDLAKIVDECGFQHGCHYLGRRYVCPWGFNHLEHDRFVEHFRSLCNIHQGCPKREYEIPDDVFKFLVEYSYRNKISLEFRIRAFCNQGDENGGLQPGQTYRHFVQIFNDNKAMVRDISWLDKVAIDFERLPSFHNESGGTNKPEFDVIKAGVNMKAVFWLGLTFLTQISR